MALTRPPASVTAVALLALVLLALLPDSAHACSMGMPSGSQQERALRDLDQATAVFSGEVLDVEKGPVTNAGFLSIVTLRISEVWKGPQRETLEVSTYTDCGPPFKEGRKVLVYAWASGKEEPFAPFEVGAGTKPLSEAGADLKAFGDGETLGGGGALVDTSGGFLGFWIIGVTGLAMATVSSGVLLRLLRTS